MWSSPASCRGSTRASAWPASRGRRRWPWRRRKRCGRRSPSWPPRRSRAPWSAASVPAGRRPGAACTCGCGSSQRVAAHIPWDTLAGTHAMSATLRALGAQVGHDVHLPRGVDLSPGCWHLLTLGDHASLARDVALRVVELDDGHVVIGPVSVGDGATLDIHAGVGPGCHIGAGASLGPWTSVRGGTRVPDGERWDGVPAARTGRTPAAPIAASPRRLGSWTHGAAIGAARTAADAAFWLPALAAALGVLTVADLRSLADLHRRLWSPGLWLLTAAASAAALSVSLGLAAWLCRLLGPEAHGVSAARSWTSVRVDFKTRLLDRCQHLAERIPVLAAVAAGGRHAHRPAMRGQHDRRHRARPGRHRRRVLPGRRRVSGGAARRSRDADAGAGGASARGRSSATTPCSGRGRSCPPTRCSASAPWRFRRWPRPRARRGSGSRRCRCRDRALQSIAGTTHGALAGATREPLGVGDGAPRVAARPAVGDGVVARSPARRLGHRPGPDWPGGVGDRGSRWGAGRRVPGAQVAAAGTRAAGRASAVVVLVQPLGLHVRGLEPVRALVRRAARRHAVAHLVPAGDGDDASAAACSSARGSRRSSIPT